MLHKPYHHIPIVSETKLRLKKIENLTPHMRIISFTLSCVKFFYIFFWQPNIKLSSNPWVVKKKTNYIMKDCFLSLTFTFTLRLTNYDYDYDYDYDYYYYYYYYFRWPLIYYQC